MKSLVAPLLGRLRVDPEARQRRFQQARAVVNGRRRGATVETREVLHLELTGCVIAGVADETAPVEDRLDLVLVIRRTVR